jgi:hypothetical protein
MQKIDDCKEIRLALTRAGIATRLEKCLQTFRLVVTAQYIYHRDHWLCVVRFPPGPGVGNDVFVSSVCDTDHLGREASKRGSPVRPKGPSHPQVQTKCRKPNDVS